MSCFMCKGSLENKETTFMVEIEGRIIIVKNVPSQVCKQCGETSYNDVVAQQLQEIVNNAKMAKTEVAIVNFKNIMVA